MMGDAWVEWGWPFLLASAAAGWWLWRFLGGVSAEASRRKREKAAHPEG